MAPNLVAVAEAPKACRLSESFPYLALKSPRITSALISQYLKVDEKVYNVFYKGLKKPKIYPFLDQEAKETMKFLGFKFQPGLFKFLDLNPKFLCLGLSLCLFLIFISFFPIL